jgi:hypothetical protein
VLRNWEECSCVKGTSPGLRRIDPVTGEIVTRPFKGQLTVDPNAIGRQYEWYTSRDEEVLIYSATDKGRGTALVFDESVNDSARDNYMRKYVFTEDAHGVHGKTASVLTQPNSLECHTLVRLENAADFEEFQRPCSSVVATRADNDVAGIKLTTTSELLCSITLGFQVTAYPQLPRLVQIDQPQSVGQTDGAASHRRTTDSVVETIDLSSCSRLMSSTSPGQLWC